jgi:hypothetical protein
VLGIESLAAAAPGRGASKSIVHLMECWGPKAGDPAGFARGGRAARSADAPVR